MAHQRVAAKVFGVEIRGGAQAVALVKTLIKGGIKSLQIDPNVFE